VEPPCRPSDRNRRIGIRTSETFRRSRLQDGGPLHPSGNSNAWAV